MIQINPLTAMLAIEALAGLAVVLLFLLYRRSSKSRSEHAEAVALVDRINQEDESHEQHLAESLSVLDDTGPLDDNMRRATVEAVLNKEKALYRLAIQAFLSRDAKKLAEIDQHVRGLSEPYCQLIQQLLKQTPPGEARAEPAPGARTADLQAELQLAKAKADTIKAQLDSAFAALDDVSKEYARMFGSTHAAETLAESLSTVQAIFQRELDAAEARIEAARNGSR